MSLKLETLCLEQFRLFVANFQMQIFTTTFQDVMFLHGRNKHRRMYHNNQRKLIDFKLSVHLCDTVIESFVQGIYI